MKVARLIKRHMGRKMALPNGKEGVCNVAAVLRNVHTGAFRVVFGANLVTNDGDQYYAEAAVGSPSWSVAGMRLGTEATVAEKTDTDVGTFLAGSGKAPKATYPKTGDADTDNTGAGVDVVTWTTEYTTAEGNGNGIAELAIVNHLTTPTKALTHALFAAPFDKTSSDTLKVIVNHTFNGV
jgi:hypothetical protein